MKKEIILEKVEDLVYKKSFEALSLAEIAWELDIKKASLYYYFPSKEILIKEVIEYSFQKYKNFVKECFSLNKKEKIIENYIDFAHKEKNLFSQINQVGYCSEKSIMMQVEAFNKEIFEIVSRLLREKFSFSEERSFLFLSLLQDISIKKCIFGDCPIDPKKLSQEIISIF